MEGLLAGSLVSISEMRSFKSWEYEGGIAGYEPLKILRTSPFIPRRLKLRKIVGYSRITVCIEGMT